METRKLSNIIEPSTFKWKILLIGRPGVGKSTWLAAVPDIGITACETGQGSGLLSAAHNNNTSADVAEPKTFADFRSVCYDTFAPFQKKAAVGLDSLTSMTKGFIMAHVLSSFPARNPREAMRRQAGVPTGFDYGDAADTTRSLLQQLLNQNKHVIVTALEKSEKDENGVVVSIGPDLPGQLALGAPALFDTVLYLKSRKVLRDPRDPKSAFYERYFVTGNDGIHIAKDRNSVNGRSFLAPEEIFDLEKGTGTFTYLLNKILAGHAAAQQVK